MDAELSGAGDDTVIAPAALEARGLTAYLEASELEIAEVGENGREHLLTPGASYAWRSLKAAALADGADLFIVSAFRSIDRQSEIIRRKLASGLSLDETYKICAPAGYSEHHTGRAVDLSTPGIPVLETLFDETPAFLWLTRHASTFGFYLSFPPGNPQGYLYEPWHWYFRGN